jgi:hypothetical protein
MRMVQGPERLSHFGRLVFVTLAAFTPQAVGEDFSSPTFYKDVLPILQEHCQSCHRPREIAPFPLVSYAETKPWARFCESR